MWPSAAEQIHLSVANHSPGMTVACKIHSHLFIYFLSLERRRRNNTTRGQTSMKDDEGYIWFNILFRTRSIFCKQPVVTLPYWSCNNGFLSLPLFCSSPADEVGWNSMGAPQLAGLLYFGSDPGIAAMRQSSFFSWNTFSAYIRW